MIKNLSNQQLKVVRLYLVRKYAAEQFLKISVYRFSKFGSVLGGYQRISFGIKAIIATYTNNYMQ